jgi:methylmalonyl-CoA mutase C-terminal domain/subunit
MSYLRERGIQEIFTPGTPLEEIISWVRTHVTPRDEL